MSYVTDRDLELDPWVLDRADELTRLLHFQHGVMSVRQALRFMSRGALRHRVENASWRHVHRGVVVVHNGPVTARQQLWVASLAAGAGWPAPLGGRSALGVLGLKGFASDRVHVLLAGGRRDADPPAGVAVHRVGSLPAEDVCATTRPPCTTAARALVDAASWANSDREALTVIAMCFQQRLVGLDDVLAVWQRLPRSKRRRLVLTAAQDAAGGAHSLGELEVLGLVRRAGLPAPSQQRERVDSTGRRRYLDFYWEQWHLHVEIDGAHHLDAARARADAARQNALWISGDRVLRFPAWAVRHDPAAVIAQIRAALIAAGWRG